MTDEQLTILAGRFCATVLPATVCADQCATDPNYAYPRTGTNLLTVAEAKEVLSAVLATPSGEVERLPPPKKCTCMEVYGEDPACIKHGRGTDWRKQNPDIAELAAKAAVCNSLTSALQRGLQLAVLTLAFHGRDRGTYRQEKMLDDLEQFARETDTIIRAALSEAGGE